MEKTKEELKEELIKVTKKREETEEINNLKKNISDEKHKTLVAKHNTLSSIASSISDGVSKVGKGLVKLVDNATKPNPNQVKTKKEGSFKLPTQEDINNVLGGKDGNKQNTIKI